MEEEVADEVVVDTDVVVCVELENRCVAPPCAAGATTVQMAAQRSSVATVSTPRGSRIAAHLL